MKNKIHPSVIICGIVCLTLIQGMAMYLGINGTFRTIISIIIAAAIGITVPLDRFIK